MAVRVTAQTGSMFGAPACRIHPRGVSWRVTKKKRLVVFDAQGTEVARYKDHRWLEVWLEDDI